MVELAGDAVAKAFWKSAASQPVPAYSSAEAELVPGEVPSL